MRIEEIGDHTIFTAEGHIPAIPCGEFMAAECYSTTMKGFLPRFVPLLSDRAGQGFPIPGGSAAVERRYVENFRPVADDYATLLRLAMHMADKEKYAVASWGGDIGVADTPAWKAEAARHGGRINFHNSLYLREKLSAENVDFGFADLDSFRPLLVSSNLSWGTKAVFEGYREALGSLGVKVATFEYDQYLRNFSTEVVRKILLGEICNVDLGLTHAIFVDGLAIPPWIVKSSPLTNILISTEDPHALDVTRLLYPYYDYVFTNDYGAAEAFGLHYLPVAAPGNLRTELPKDIPEEYRCDVLFLGAIYPTRKKFLEFAAEVCRRRGWKISIIGPRYKCDLGPGLSEIVDERTVSAREAMLRQAGAKVCLNLFRDAADADSGHNQEFRMDGFSMNPRCYDVPACGSCLLTDYRPEVQRIFGLDPVMNKENLEAKLEKCLEDSKYKKEKTDREAKTVYDGHLYLHRALVLAGCVRKGFLTAAQ
jgi:hypothetical protein